MQRFKLLNTFKSLVCYYAKQNKFAVNERFNQPSVEFHDYVSMMTFRDNKCWLS